MKNPNRCVGAGLLGRPLLLLVSALCLWSSMWLHAQTWGPFTYQRNGETIEITGYTGTERSLAIPERIEGRPVTSLSPYALRSSITNLSLPSTLISLGDSLNWLEALEAITVADGNPNFSSRDGVLFNQDQSRLIQFPRARTGDTYVIPDTVTRIEAWAFGGCKSLTHLVISAHVVELGEDVFDAMGLSGRGGFRQSLSWIELVGENPAFQSHDGVLFNKEGSVLVRYPPGRAGGYSIPPGVTSIGPSAFERCSRLRHIAIPDSVVRIGELAFYRAGLQTVVIGRGVTHIGNGAFDNRFPEWVGCPCYGPSATGGGRIDLYFLGSAPQAAFPFGDRSTFWGRADYSEPPRVFHLAGVAGWGTTFGGEPTIAWEGEPVLVSQPISGGGYAGVDFHLSVQSLGLEPLRFQWQRDEVDVPGATNAMLSLSHLRTADAGSWRVRVSNSYGAVTSEVASVTVRVPVTNSYEAAALALGPLAYWPLDETEGVNAIEFMSGSLGVYSTVDLGQPGATANTGTSVDFSMGDSLLAGENPAWDVGTGDFTVAAWIYPMAFRSSGIVAMGGYDSAQGWRFDFNAVGEGSLRLETSTGSPGGQGTVQTPPGVVTLNEWQHVVVSCRRDSGAGSGLNSTGNGWTQIYRNGVRVASGDIGPGDLDDPGLSLTLGRILNDAAFFLGRMDEVALFGRALSAGQIADLYAVATGTPRPLHIERSGDRLTLTWSSGVLQRATALGDGRSGPNWADLPGVTSPYTIETISGASFFRVRTH
jgi:hypothetical protein